MTARLHQAVSCVSERRGILISDHDADLNPLDDGPQVIVVQPAMYGTRMISVRYATSGAEHSYQEYVSMILRVSYVYIAHAS